MYARFSDMQNKCSASAMCAEEGAFACAILLLGSAIAAESIFIAAVSAAAVLLLFGKMSNRADS